MKDKVVASIIKKEIKIERTHIELIASENFVSKDVLTAQGSVFTNKYAEGYPGKRYYGGCENIDSGELLAIERACKLFHVKYANVQPHSGSTANMAAYRSVLNLHDKVLAMKLDQGGHLTHGQHLNFSGIDYDFSFYGVNKDTEMIDYDEILKIAKEVKPKLIVAGASAYPRAIDFKKFKDIANEVGALLMVDMAHIAGLVASGLHQNPCDYADVVTSTTHKTLRGPRGGIILTNNKDIFDKINKTIFPGIQGGPLEHVILAKAVCFGEAQTEAFKEYSKQVIKNAQALSDTLKRNGFRIVSGGTDNHLLLVDTLSKGITGKTAETILGSINITVNKNIIPFDKESPNVTSGIRLGSPAMTTLGFKEKEFEEIGEIITEALMNHENEETIKTLKKRVMKLVKGIKKW